MEVLTYMYACICESLHTLTYMYMDAGVFKVLVVFTSVFYWIKVSQLYFKFVFSLIIQYVEKFIHFIVTQAHIYICMYVCMHTHTHIYIYVYIYIYIFVVLNIGCVSRNC